MIGKSLFSSFEQPQSYCQKSVHGWSANCKTQSSFILVSLKQNKNEQKEFTCVQYLQSFLVNIWFPNSYLCFTNRYSFLPQRRSVCPFGSLIYLLSAGAQQCCKDEAV